MNLVKVVAFDVAGTTIQDGGVVLDAFASAFKNTQPDLWATRQDEVMKFALDTMGQSKIEVFTAIIGNIEEATVLERAFEDAYLDGITERGVKAIDGAEDIFKSLKSNDVKVALTTGFTRITLDAIINHLRWTDYIDFSTTPFEAGAGRPDPAMLYSVAGDFGIIDHNELLAVGDTTSDMKAAKNFKTDNIVGVLSGTHDEPALRSAGATSIIGSVAELHTLLQF